MPFIEPKMTSILPDADIKPVGSYPKTGIDVLIVGTGLAGLAAALEAVRKGHNVKIVERDDDLNTAGDMFFLGHSGVRFLRHWPEMAREYVQFSMKDAYVATLKHSGEVMLPPTRVSDRMSVPGQDPNSPVGSFQMRPAVYSMFIRQLERLGVPVEFGKRVVDYYEDEERGKAGAVTDKEEKIEADVVIAADGIGSKSQSLVGGQVRAVSSGRALWRAIVPWSCLEDSPEVSEAFELATTETGSVSCARAWLGQVDSFAFIPLWNIFKSMRPGCYAMTMRRPDSCIWILNHASTNTSMESWTNHIYSDEVLANMDKGCGGVSWSPAFKELVRRTPKNTIVNFELLWRNPQPSWSSPGGRVVNIGDAAHSYLPTSGNGATQAMEDAVSLVSCLQIGGRANVPEAVRAHVRFRFIRTACIQKLGFATAETFTATDWDAVKANPKSSLPRAPGWIWRHDAEAYAYDHYDKMVETMREGVPFDEIPADVIPPNYPPGYKYEPWSIDNIIDDTKAGKRMYLGSGEWFSG